MKKIKENKYWLKDKNCPSKECHFAKSLKERKLYWSNQFIKSKGGVTLTITNQ